MKHWNVAAYIRLSKEDGDNLESNSITNQKDIIKQFVDNCPDMTIVEYYIDDGYSGTNFDRPAIKKLMDDIVDENGNADLFYGYLICNECGATLRKSQKYYYCNTYSRTRKCSKHSTNRARLINNVINDINKKVEKYKNLTELNRDIMFEIINSIKICEDGRIIIKYKK